MTLVLHGTTRQRAERIAAVGPDPEFVEPGGGRAEGFSTSLAAGPFLFGMPEDYARRKAALFPDEAGPAILAVDVPDEIIERATDEYFPRAQGLIQFDPDSGLEPLLAAWPNLAKEVRLLPASP